MENCSNLNMVRNKAEREVNFHVVWIQFNFLKVCPKYCFHRSPCWEMNKEYSAQTTFLKYYKKAIYHIYDQ